MPQIRNIPRIFWSFSNRIHFGKNKTLCDQAKATRVKTYDKLLAKERNKYKMEEEPAQNNSKRSRIESESSQS